MYIPILAVAKFNLFHFFQRKEIMELKTEMATLKKIYILV